jgi:hypothetical protein
MGVGSRRSHRFPAQCRMAARVKRLSPALRRWACACWRSASSKVKVHPRFSRSLQLRQHESVGLGEGASSFGRAPADRLEHQASGSWFAPYSVASGWPDTVFAFHDSEEVGPHMLARIAKKTGLTPRDL